MSLSNGPVKLSRNNLYDLPSEFILPQYDPSEVTPGILHIGPSAFFRSHFACFVHQRLNDASLRGEPLNWGIRAVSLRTTDVHDALEDQDYLYSLTTKGKGQFSREVIGSITDIMCARNHVDEVIEAAASPDIRVMSLTVTQSGYYYDEKNGLDFEHKDIQACLNQDSPELSSIGLIAHSMKLRKELGVAPPVVLSCDNYPANGTKLRNAVMAYANRLEAGLGDWISDNVPFPNTMVDRITPRTGSALIDDVAKAGVVEAWPVEAEPMPNPALVVQLLNVPVKAEIFKQSGLETLTSKGIIFDENVANYEHMKLRTLNGVHMALGCVGHLMGYAHTHRAMENFDIRQFTYGFMQEVGQALKPVDAIDLDDFRANVVDRLDNPEICDELTRLVRNGTDKVRPRLLDSVRDCIALQKPYKHLAFAFASWMHYCASLDDQGHVSVDGKRSAEPNDAKGASLGLPQQFRDNSNVAWVGSYVDVMPKDLAGSSDFMRETQSYFDSIKQNGMVGALEQLRKETGPRLVAPAPVVA